MYFIYINVYVCTLIMLALCYVRVSDLLTSKWGVIFENGTRLWFNDVIYQAGINVAKISTISRSILVHIGCRAIGVRWDDPEIFYTKTHLQYSLE